MKSLAVVLALCATSARSDSWNNEAGIYALAPLPAATAEALRLDTDEREDQQPLGRMVQAGDQLLIGLPDLPTDIDVSLLVGFRPMWGDSRYQQVEPLGPGETTVTATQGGPLYLRVTGAGPDVTVNLSGGQRIPLYVDGAMTAADWQAELDQHKGATFIQLVGEKAMITLTRDAYARHPIPDPAASFAMIDQVLKLEDDLSGLDGSEPMNAPTPLRQHFIVDFRATAADRENFYMYATDGFIGMLPDNSGDLTDPFRLSQEWAIWHEVGHIHQQNSWTWGSATEITVNIWSLFVQESLGNPSRLAGREDGKSIRAQARDYIGQAGGPPDFLIDDYDTVFIRLVMFDQLARTYGWDLFRALNQATRSNPLPPDASDQDKVDFFVLKLCLLTGHDLRPFFSRWNLTASDAVLAHIDEMDFDLPPKDPARRF